MGRWAVPRSVQGPVRGERGVTAGTNVRKVFCKGGGHLQDPGTGMADEPAQHLEQPPTHGGDAMSLPAFAEGRVFEEYEDVMGNDTDPEEGGVGTLLPARHALHGKAHFEMYWMPPPTEPAAGRFRRESSLDQGVLKVPRWKFIHGKDKEDSSCRLQLMG